jgi:hypothetical protein
MLFSCVCGPDLSSVVGPAETSDECSATPVNRWEWVATDIQLSVIQQNELLLPYQRAQLLGSLLLTRSSHLSWFWWGTHEDKSEGGLLMGVSRLSAGKKKYSDQQKKLARAGWFSSSKLKARLQLSCGSNCDQWWGLAVPVSEWQGENGIPPASSKREGQYTSVHFSWNRLISASA